MTTALARAPFYRDLDRHGLFPYVHELERRFDGKDVIRTIVHPPGQEDFIVAFVLGAPNKLTYLHVRGGYRGKGIATHLARSLLGVGFKGGPGPTTIVEFPTNDLVRSVVADWPGALPIGLINNPLFDLTVKIWHPNV